MTRVKGTLVLLHGVASNSTRWAEFIANTRLKQTWKLLAPDLRGSGSAALPRARLDMQTWCTDLVALLDAERCERAVIAGHCLGGNIALQFACRYPERTAAIVLIEPMPAEALVGTMRALMFLKPLLYFIYAGARALNFLGIYRRRLEQLDLREWDRAIRSGEIRLSPFASLWIDLKTTPLAAYARMLIATVERWPDVAKIRMPVLSFVSTRSSFTDAERTRRALAEMAECDLVEIDAVHWIPTEQPEAMRARIEDWLGRRFPASSWRA